MFALVAALVVAVLSNVAEGSPTGVVAPLPRMAPAAPAEDGRDAVDIVTHDRTPASTAAGAGGLADLPFIPFHEKRGEYVGALRLGLWPGERRPTGDAAYANPAGFYRVAASQHGHPVSARFTVGEFAMREGMRGPDGETYVVLREPLLEKLEATLDELARRGVLARDFTILSGFRAPHYNRGVEGAAPSSRHQFGDAADVIVDDDGDGRMDDLNGDGRVDRADLFIIADAIAAVEARDPSLAGGLGLYDAMGPSGPLLHIDVRGRATRWGTALSGAPATAPAWSRRASPSASTQRPAARRPGCKAEGASAILCTPRRGGR